MLRFRKTPLPVIAPLLLTLLVAFTTPRLLTRWKTLRAADCDICRLSNCDGVPAGGYITYLRTDDKMYCLDYDGIPPPHCCKVHVKVYAVRDASTDKFWFNCYFCNCQGVPDNSSPCAYALPVRSRKLGNGDYGRFSVIGGGAAPDTDTRKGDSKE